MRSFFFFLALLVSLAATAIAQPGAVLLQDASGSVLSVYATIQQAYDAVPTPLTQAYTIAIDSSYNGLHAPDHFPIRFTEKAGSSAVNTITIQPRNRNYWLTRIISRSDSSEMFLFDGGDWIIIDGERATPDPEAPCAFSFRSIPSVITARSIYPGIRFINGATHNVIRYCEAWNGRKRDGLGDEADILFDTTGNGTGNSYNIIEHNNFDTEHAIRSNGSTAHPNEHNTISNNLFNAVYGTALVIGTGTAALEFSHNELVSNTDAGHPVAMVRVEHISDTLRIINNTFRLYRSARSDSALTAIALMPAAANTPDHFCLIANNYITTGGSYVMNHNVATGPYRKDSAIGKLTAIAIHASFPVSALLAHNTVRLNSADAPEIVNVLYSAAFTKSGTNTGGSIRLLNNILYNDRRGGGTGTLHAALDIADTSGLYMDYNTYHTAAAFARVAGTVFNGLTAYQSAFPSQDTHASNAVVAFEAIDTYLLSTSMIDELAIACAPLALVPADMDGDLRTIAHRGADEIVTTCTSIGMSSIYSYAAEACPAKPVYLQYAENTYFAPVLPAGGIIHQWQSRALTATDFTDIVGQHSADLLVTQNEQTTYRVKDSCISTGQVIYTNLVTVPMKPSVVLDSITVVHTGGFFDDYEFTVHTTGTPTGYYWEMGDGPVTTTANTITHHYFFPGTYTITVYTDAQCSDPVSITITTGVPVTSVNSLSLNGFRIFPNPAHDQLQVIGNRPIGLISIMDITGRSILQASTTENKISLNTGNIANGIYFLRLTNDEQKVLRFIVNH